MRSGRRIRLAALVATLAVSPAIGAAPAEPEHVILPGHEDAARALLRDVLERTPSDLQWRGPSIDIDRVRWRLEHDGELLVELVALPRALGEQGRAHSESFTIVVHEAADARLDDGQRALLDAAVESILRNDAGGFYVHRETAFEAELPYARAEPSTPARVHRRWALEFAVVGLFGLAAFVVTFRSTPERRTESAEPDRRG